MDHRTSVDIAKRLAELKKNIARCETDAKRPSGSVILLAVSKTQPTEAIIAAYAAGQRAFAENYAQELGNKAAALQALDIEWHFIGPLQSNKTRLVANRADWVHSVDRLKLAQRLSAQRPKDKTPLQLCLQVNIDNEETKSGVAVDALPELAGAIRSLPRLRLRGLMCVPKHTTDPATQRETFARMRVMFEELNQQGFELDTLSMGMSGDYPAAIKEGATIIRIGTAIFGPRR